MLFFFIVPVWLLFVLIGVVLLFRARQRRIGWYAIIVSTTATLTSFLLSTAVLYIGARIGAHANLKWLGVAVIGAYILTMGVGIALGGIAGFFLVRSSSLEIVRHSVPTPSKRRLPEMRALASMYVAAAISQAYFRE
jgi:hypothetical protein